MRFDVITLFPDMITGVLQHSILKRAQEKELLEVYVHNMRDVAEGIHKTVDDTPYGGGAGMLLKVDIVDKALQKLLSIPEINSIAKEKRRTILLCAQGKLLSQARARFIANHYEQVTLICGHYEGFDERIRSLVDAEMSIGNYVLTGGELPALVVIDTVTRLLPEVIRALSPEEESFSLMDEAGQPLLEYPHYTRPLSYKDMTVPDILLSGHHAEIQKWRMEQAKLKSQSRAHETDQTI